MSDTEDVDLEHSFTCDPATLPDNMERAAGSSPVERAILLGEHYGREAERDRRIKGLPPTRHPARLPGAPPSCPSYQEEAQNAAMLGGQVVSRLLRGVEAYLPGAPAAPAPKASHGIEFSGNPIAWIKRLFRRGR